jgi:sodium-dependent dicarboxylate transporter 2/3/5
MTEERSLETGLGTGKAGEIGRGEVTAIREASQLSRIFRGVDWKRILFMVGGISLFVLVYASPPWPDAVDPIGKHFELSREGKAAIGLFALAVTWWVFEVIPIGVTSVAVAVIQALFLIRDPKVAFTDFMDPSVWFIFASLVIGMAFTRTGLTQRMAYKMLTLVGERTSMIYLGCFTMIAVLTLMMAHTAVAAAMFPLLMAIYSLYEEDTAPTKFGKGLFIGMAYVCGAGSIVTLLGAARGAVAIGFFRDMAGREVTFFELTYYMLPLGWVMIILLWTLTMLLYPPEKKVIPGLRDRVKVLSERLGPMKRTELLALTIVLAAILVLALRSFLPALRPLDKSAVMLMCTVLFFLLKILTVKDLEEIPWNIILLFGGAMSIGFCLWQTGAANWIAVEGLALLQNAHWFVFVMAIAFFVLIMTNFIMNVAAIAISMPVAFVMARYLGVSPEVIMFASLATAGMPFLVLVGAAPNAIAFESRQFSSAEFFRIGIPATIMLMAVLGIFIWLVWPLMGMPVLLQ